MGRLSDPQKLELYRFLRLNRVVEERLVNLYRQGKVVGGLYRSLGQEATSVGTAYALAPGDFLSPLIRNLGSVLVRGYAPRELFAQYLARASSPSGGKDGNLHFASIERGVIGPISMLGELIPVMAGVALAAKLRKRDIVCMTYIGDGATSTGPFHEGMNFAAVRKLPLVVVGENNHWAYSTPLSQQMACATLADRARAYGMPAVTVDGTDVALVWEAASEAVARARRGEGPVFLEAVTYRMKGHAEHDAQDYVDKEELAAWRDRDPIERWARALESAGTATAGDLARIDAEVAAHVDRELEIAEAAPAVAPERALDGVYAEVRREREPYFLRYAEGKR
ncbi:MAG TPA: thiamine pyrophosphate-dependent dehydrogenase E1 component subunit alpha [Thermoanaerobaculia bacterium]|nr:thiamine pyrophosphate-dependent dehydrogenase E1 component subunit alpha [Thermoanaerobaculia bacterium]